MHFVAFCMRISHQWEGHGIHLPFCTLGRYGGATENVTSNVLNEDDI